MAHKRLLSLLPQWAQASLFVVSLSLIGKVLGLWRELETAKFFGVSPAADAFVAAYALLVFLARMASDSFLVSMPRLAVGRRERGEQDQLWGNLFRALLWVSAALTLVAALFLPRLVPLVFGGLDAVSQTLTVRLVEWMLPLVAGWTLIGAFGGILNSQHRYGGFQVALIVANVGVLVVLWATASRVGIVALAWGWSLGIWLGVGVLALLLRVELRHLLHWDGWQLQWQMLRSLFWGSSGLFVWYVLTQMPLWFDRYFAATLAPGSLAALAYAQRLFQLPLELVTTVVMSIWVVRVAEMQRDEVAPRTFGLMRRLALITFPLSVIMALLARPIITVVYARGAFGAQAVAMTTGPFMMYSLGLGFLVLSAILVRSFQARGLTRYPTLAAVLDILLTGTLDAWVVSQGWGATGIAAVSSVVAAVRTGVLTLCLYRLAAR